MKNRFFLIFLLCLFLITTAFSSPIIKGDDLSGLCLSDLNGNVINISSYQGSFACLTFVAFWCDTYKEVIEGYGRLYDELKGHRVKYCLLFIDKRFYKNADPILKELISVSQTPIDIYLDETEKYKRDFSIAKVPVFILIDPNGRVLYVQNGYPSNALIKELIFYWPK